MLTDNHFFKKRKTFSSNKEFDEVDFATSWKRACSYIFTQVSWLHEFQNINIVAFERILFKLKDRFKNNLMK